jgi:hypothetical protein
MKCRASDAVVSAGGRSGTPAWTSDPVPDVADLSFYQDRGMNPLIAHLIQTIGGTQNCPNAKDTAGKGKGGIEERFLAVRIS